MDTEQVVVITKEKFDEACMAEVRRILDDSDYQEAPIGAMALAMGGFAFAKSVWMRLMGERE